MKKLLQPKPIAVITSISMFFVLIGGALVTKTESGLGCGRSWPLCDGQLIPSEITFELVVEFGHRLMSGLGIILVLLLSYIAWKDYRDVKETKFLVFLSILFLIIQSLLGAAAVLIEQSSLVKALHFGISLVAFAAVVLLAIIIFDVDRKLHTENVHIPKWLRIHFIGLFIYTLIVVYSGALVRHKYSSLVCPDWPFCYNDAPINSGLGADQWIQMGHRGLAGILFIWVIYVFIQVLRKIDNPFIRKAWTLGTVFILLQVILGAFIIFTTGNVIVGLLHATFISLFFTILSYFLMLGHRSRIAETK